MIYFGDAYSAQQFGIDVVTGGVLGGVAGGVAGWLKNRELIRAGKDPFSLWNGKPIPAATPKGAYGTLGDEGSQAMFPDGIDPITGKAFQGGDHTLSTVADGGEFLDDFARIGPEQPFVGVSFGKLGVATLNHPKIPIRGLTNHAAQRAAQRGMSQVGVYEVVDNPLVILRQPHGRYGFLNSNGFVVLASDGSVITTYSRTFFDQTILNILNQVGGL